ncbi:MAG TPA: hypothetical protein VMF10_10105 [Candidatus Aquilonibacter sp.]|nr:hypothetical protein [Candidatus Aquilonibacter sp.]
MDTKVMRAVLAESQAGKLTFGEVVRRLVEVGVESYFVDFARRDETFYMPDGETYAEKMTVPVPAIANEFSTEGIVAAIRAAQADTIRYPEFVKRATAAGVIGYWAFLSGRNVTYIGRRGETHVERFPPAKP